MIALGLATVAAMLVTIWCFSRPVIPLEVRKQIETDIRRCGGELKEARCAVNGVDDWIFLQESLVNLVVDWKENLNSFVAFNDSLEARGIKLVVVPVPDKLQIEAEHYSEEMSGGIVAPQYEEWVDALQDEGVVVVDAVEEFLEKNEETPMFEAYESHYTSAGRQLLAQMIADTINGMDLDVPRGEWFLRDTVVPGSGNLYHLKYNSYPDYDVRVLKTVDAEGKRYHGSKDAPIVVIGDSNADFGWNSSSNIGAYIAQATGIKTFTRSRIGGGNFGPTLFKGRSKFLEGKKMVVWVFDGRELYGDFSMPEF
jgi:hypothetical protein